MGFLYDIIVVGAGHAGCEAALAGARMGFSTLLITMNLDTIAQMSCNPAIGGLAKGHLVKEIDALGGEMARIADLSAIQFRMLNTKKGPAVWAPRVQSDKKVYQQAMKQVLERQERLTVLQDTVTDILVDKGSVRGVATVYQQSINARAVIITPGTFLNGLIHIGLRSFPSGRFGEFASTHLSDSLQKIGLKLGRLKTGTPARVLRSSINFDKLTPYPPDDKCETFSREIKKFPLPQVPCYITYTTQRTKEIILENLHLSPLYSGKITGIGPRYCPSIEDKIVKFPDKTAHQIFIEPEGLSTDEMYVNGASSSLPQDVQEQIYQSITGLENVRIMRYAYGIEYDFVTTDQILPTLETRSVGGLYLAGQINGTSGYEEASAQGLIAGINAALKIRGSEPFILRRDEAYIGVMIDDLITKIPEEPYRMFTSRAEYRLLLRQDNAYQRLAVYGNRFGLIDDATLDDVLRSMERVSAEVDRLGATAYRDITVAGLLRRQDWTYQRLIAERIISEPSGLTDTERFQVELEIKYEGYIKRQHTQVDKMKKYDMWNIPSSLSYENITGLRREAREKLVARRPATIGQALRIPGVNPADVQLIMIHTERLNRSNTSGKK
ncbi:MAG: tRNA uridine-5-carboxymethylaminomethyl(34) synthesis enzyme MnmG [Candidatus Auribacterota bacterium]|jgi:tRNA uridine 5-carboxymethylaminomethyl modification enzyme|nr:tRNA uridine-5-carboxymethylaminomethyl(34) synthesis enzyme MnmG [Candidatus Auribacterota bacterium]